MLWIDFDGKAEPFFGTDAFNNSKSDVDNAFDATFDNSAFENGFDQPSAEDKKDKSRKGSKSKITGLSEGMDGLEIDESEKKERRSRPSKKEDGVKQSGKSRRKPNRQKSTTGEPEKKGIKKANSFRGMFTKKQTDE